jgi:hypothetical protein
VPEEAIEKAFETFISKNSIALSTPTIDEETALISPVTEVKPLDIWMGKYSNKSFIVGGKDVRKIKDVLLSLDGQWKASLQKVKQVYMFPSENNYFETVKTRLEEEGLHVEVNDSYYNKFENVVGEFKQNVVKPPVTVVKPSKFPKPVAKDSPQELPTNEEDSKPSIKISVKSIKGKTGKKEYYYSRDYKILFEPFKKVQNGKTSKTLRAIGHRETIDGETWTLNQEDVDIINKTTYSFSPKFVTGKWRLKKLSNDEFYHPETKLVFQSTDQGVICVSYRENEGDEEDSKLTLEDLEFLKKEGYKWDSMAVDNEEDGDESEDEAISLKESDASDQSEGESDGEED